MESCPAPDDRLRYRTEEDSALCPYCHEPYAIELLEVFPEDRSFQVMTCCERSQEELAEEFHPDVPSSQRLASWLNTLGWAHITGSAARSVYVTLEGHVEVDQRLQLQPITFAAAKDFIRRYHRHNAPPVGWRFGCAVYNWNDLVGVATCGRPTARRLDPERIVEITRVCIHSQLPRPLIRNAASMLYGACVREARRRQFERVITYTLQSEIGTSLRAAGFNPVWVTADQRWDRRARPRRAATPCGSKVRWEKTFPQFAGIRAARARGTLDPEQLSVI